MDFTIPAGHWGEIKENEKRGSCLEKKLEIMKVKFLPTVIGALGTVSKDLVRSLEKLKIGRRIEPIKTKALVVLARILGRVLGNCSHSNERPSGNASIKTKSQERNL